MAVPPSFDFDFGPVILEPEKDFIARIPAGLRSREVLFEALCRELQLPSYFGKNWDALSDCLRDLHWIKCRRVVLLHEDWPLLDEKATKTYLDLLSGAVQSWKSDEEHELIVTFPAKLGSRRRHPGSGSET